ncbi:glycoside hydrolase superfamily [Dactylonectria macrodidyma]|uniref:beta-glucosidase n=1 Tax=Dactylonectria macrodidyma TaxID=307937 RepID=A0A9P9DLX0_9HYPO|nr:glycoside hydrolase superfamily [Dactylonectria macrodidyma]
MALIDTESILRKLNDREKVSLLAGIDFWHTKAFPEHGVPSLRLSDEPNGVRGTRFFNSVPAAYLPYSTALGSAFDKDLILEAGSLIGEEAKAKGAHAVLGPTINMQRSPLGGRGFEPYSEDPVVSGMISAAFINGMQSKGVVAALKHFVCKDQEHERNNSRFGTHNPNLSCLRTTKVNGTHAAESKRLLQDVLRKEWNWKGLIMSDWLGTYSTSESINAGLDLEMPGPSRWRGEAAVIVSSTNKLDANALDNCARAVLNLVNDCAASGMPEKAPEHSRDTPETSALLRRLAADAVVLRKNTDNILPLFKDKKSARKSERRIVAK